MPPLAPPEGVDVAAGAVVVTGVGVAAPTVGVTVGVPGVEVTVGCPESASGPLAHRR